MQTIYQYKQKTLVKKASEYVSGIGWTIVFIVLTALGFITFFVKAFPGVILMIVGYMGVVQTIHTLLRRKAEESTVNDILEKHVPKHKMNVLTEEGKPLITSTIIIALSIMITLILLPNDWSIREALQQSVVVGALTSIIYLAVVHFRLGIILRTLNYHSVSSEKGEQK